MRRFRLGVLFAACSLIAVIGLWDMRLGSTYATFGDSATGSSTVTANANFVPLSCQSIGSTLAAWNVIKGTQGNDTITGTVNNDLIFGLGGDDVITGGNQADCLVGGDGSDNLSGGNQGDVLLGGNGNDALNGGNQTDTCDGGADTDTAVNCEVLISVP